MEVKRLVELAKLTKDKKIIEDIIKHYEPYFSDMVKRIYGKEYCGISVEILPMIINYYFENNIKEDLSTYLVKNVKNIFKVGRNFNELIKSENSKMIKFYYIYFMHQRLFKNCKTQILSKEELFELCSKDVTTFYNNYIRTEKRTNASFYFLKLIERQLGRYQDEDVLLLTYAKKVKVTDNIKNYFYDKYKDLLSNYCNNDIVCYKTSIDNALNLKVVNIFGDFKTTVINQIEKYHKAYKAYIINEIQKVKNHEDADIEEIKKYYSYIKDLFFDNLHCKVNINDDELENLIDIKYEDYFKAGIIYISNNKDGYLASYINNRLKGFFYSLKYLYKNDYIEDKKQNIK